MGVDERRARASAAARTRWCRYRFKRWLTSKRTVLAKARQKQVAELADVERRLAVAKDELAWTLATTQRRRAITDPDS